MGNRGKHIGLVGGTCLLISPGFASAGDTPGRLDTLQGVNVLAQPIDTGGGLTLVATVDPGFDINHIRTSFNVNAADTTNTDVIQAAPYNLTGLGTVIGMWEIGRPRATHQEFGGGISYGDGMAGTVDQHATHVAGTLSALGIDANAKGMARLAVVRSYDAQNDTAEIQAAAGLIASNHSYGFTRGWDQSTNFDNVTVERTWFADRETFNEDPGFGKYDASTAGLDAALHANNRLLSVWAASNDRDDNVNTFPVGAAGQYLTFFSQGSDGPGGNPPGFYRLGTAHATFPAPGQDGNNGAGYDSLPQSQVAKNSLTVGAIEDITAEGAARTAPMTVFSSWGPTDDGRIKPDVVGNGHQVYSASNGADNAYATLNGTSMASPNVAGTMALVNQRLMTARNSTDIPLSATSKALAIHTAHDLYNAGPDYQSGYGVLDAQAAVEFVDDSVAANPTDFIIEHSFGGTDHVASYFALGGEVKATLVWNDLAGTAADAGLDSNALKLVNNLDLFITDASNNVYYPWTLDPANPNNAAVRTLANFRDNVEQVVIDIMFPGDEFTIHINMGGALTGLSQDWTLLVSGAVVPEPGALAIVALPALLLTRRRRGRAAR